MPKRDRAPAVADGEQPHQGDKQPATGHSGAQHGKDRRAHHHAQRIGADDVAGSGCVDAQRLREVGQQTHRGELGGSDGEAADSKGKQHQGGPVLRRRGVGHGLDPRTGHLMAGAPRNAMLSLQYGMQPSAQGRFPGEAVGFQRRQPVQETPGEGTRALGQDFRALAGDAEARQRRHGGGIGVVFGDGREGADQRGQGAARGGDAWHQRGPARDAHGALAVGDVVGFAGNGHDRLVGRGDGPRCRG
ncbi:hypothetical protein G6F22_015044 [Rhizopus arrhizus]|nr:hypothetical protein G6F22_015044 [Rhizopus arrhizus]